MKAVKYSARLTVCAVKRVFGWFEEHRIQVYASQAAFFIILSSVPMLIIAVAVAGRLIPLSDNYGRILARFSPSQGEALKRIIAEAKGKASMPLVSVSAAALAWSASRGIRGIGGGVRNVYGGEKESRIIVYAIKSLVLTLLYVCSVLLALLVWVFGDIILARTADPSGARALKLINGSALFMLLSAVFILTYRAFGGRRRGEIKEAPGAFFSAAGWLLFSWIFEYYVEHFGRYSYVYGGIGSLVVVMLWLYFCMEILLIGAGINVLISKKDVN